MSRRGEGGRGSGIGRGRRLFDVVPRADHHGGPFQRVVPAAPAEPHDSCAKRRRIQLFCSFCFVCFFVAVVVVVVVAVHVHSQLGGGALEWYLVLLGFSLGCNSLVVSYLW